MTALAFALVITLSLTEIICFDRLWTIFKEREEAKTARRRAVYRRKAYSETHRRRTQAQNRRDLWRYFEEEK